MIINLPHKFEPRHYQTELMRAVLIDGKKRAVQVIHRRAGKDKASLNLAIALSQIRVGTTLYLLPEQIQARKAIWNGIDSDGMRYLDHIPKELIEGTPHSSDMRINFKNGSIFQLGGADQYNKWLSTNPVNIIFDEYSVMNPLAWHYLSPILRENSGIAIFNYTPRGRNHGYKLYQVNKDNAEWYCSYLTVEDTKRNDGTYVISPEMVEEERKAGIPEEQIQQEYYCSWDAATPGAYFTTEMKRMATEERLCEFPINRDHVVNTYWDIGVSDSTAIWLVQTINKIPKAIGYYEFQGQALAHYINWLHQFREQYGIVFGKHYAPHDVVKRDFNTGKSTIDFARDLGFIFEVVPRVKHLQDGIESLRSLLNIIYINSETCEQGVECLRSYHREYNERLQNYSKEPCHDWSSHGVDALRMLAQSWRQDMQSGGYGVFKNRISAGSIF